jgi:hypothetical protein
VNTLIRMCGTIDPRHTYDEYLVLLAKSGMTARQPNPVPQTNQVMNQVEFPPFRGPSSPLDLVAIKIIFGHIFEAF